MKKYKPADSLKSPRFCGIRTFMRLPHLPTAQEADFAVIGVPFDTDFVDAAYAPGTGTPKVGGFTSAEALPAVRGLKSSSGGNQGYRRGDDHLRGRGRLR